MKRLRLFVLVAAALIAAPVDGQNTPTMTAHFIDVGQAHATLLEFSCGAYLVDAGAQDDTNQAKLMETLEAFFKRRSDLNRTLNAILITHNHIDHTRALQQIVETFNVQRYIDNGWTTGSGRFGPNWLKGQVASGQRNVELAEVSDSEVEAVKGKQGLTSAVIDPLACADQNPQIRVLQGSFDENPGWPDGEFENQNNHSLVTRVDFGQASFVFMGDLEEAGIELLVDYYAGGASRLLDADVIQVGHHGSHNATTPLLLNAVTPSIAVIPVGDWTFGQNVRNNFTTFAFGHPRKNAVELLSTVIARRRSPSKTVRVATKAKAFSSLNMTKAIYATGWDGNVDVVARANGAFIVHRQH